MDSTGEKPRENDSQSPKQMSPFAPTAIIARSERNEGVESELEGVKEVVDAKAKEEVEENQQELEDQKRETESAEESGASASTFASTPTTNSSSTAASLLQRIVFHPEETTLCVAVETILSYSLLLKEGRLLFRGAVERNKELVEKNIHLLADSIIITSTQVDGSLMFETLIELSSTTLQVRCDNYNELLQSDHRGDGGDNNDSSGGGSDFVNTVELSWESNAYLEICTRTREERDDWMTSILDVIHENTKEEDKCVGWKHKIRLGTIHSAVMMRDTLLIERFKEHCEDGLIEYTVFDLQDEEGYAPIHIACAYKMTFIVEILLEIGIDVTIRDKFGSTPLHYSSLLLDDVILEKLCGQIFDTDLPDDFGYTPLALACIGGRDSNDGTVDYTALQACMEILLALGADVNVTDANGFSLLQIAVFNWQASVVHSLLKIMEPSGFIRNNDCTLMHDLCSCRRIRSEGSAPAPFDKMNVIEESTADALNIAELLISHGTSLNLLCEGTYNISVLELVARNYTAFGDDFQAMLDLLISSGARPDFSSMITLSALEQKISSINDLIPKSIERWQSKDALSATGINMQGFQLPKVMEDQKKRCIACGFTYTMFKRKQKCSVCNLGFCDACSKKKVDVNGSAGQRCCDGCYNKLIHKLGSEQERLFMSGKMKNLPSLKEQEEQNLASKQNLMRGATGEIVKPSSSSSANIYKEGGMEALKSHLGEAQDKLRERGEKLSQLSEKTDKLQNGAGEFAKLAKELNSSRSSWW